MVNDEGNQPTNELLYYRKKKLSCLVPELMDETNKSMNMIPININPLSKTV